MLGELQDLYIVAKKAEAALDAVNNMKGQLDRIEQEVKNLKTLMDGYIHGKQK